MLLKKVTIHKYKSVESDQSFNVESDITVLVGMNESGKTSILEALAKSNYFQDDNHFKYNSTHDYPRREKKKIEKTGITPNAINCIYTISDSFHDEISKNIGNDVFSQPEISITVDYVNKRTWNNLEVNSNKFVQNILLKLGIFSQSLYEKVIKIKNTSNLEELIVEFKDQTYIENLHKLDPYFKNVWDWDDPIQEYIARAYLQPRLPKFLYYDEYYALPSRISIEDLEGEALEEEELKTAKALFDLADINTKELINSEDYEDFKAELEATQATITDELFKYWATNKNLEIIFDIDKVEEEVSRNVQTNYGQNALVQDIKIVKHILDIRVKNRRTGVSLPLKNRSKGFNWFFSFLVWFKKIQEDKNQNYILLLDEPGLNLHATAQSNLLRFFKDLSKDYQIIYTTHSPFMIESETLNKVRTILETDNGTIISESVQEKDPNTLFPLQAALGYDIAQNLFISKYNLLVEGVSDLVYLQVMSSILQSKGRTGLDNKITIVPTGGLDKVATFISLLRGSELNIICLLDSGNEGKFRDLIEQKIISKNKIKFFDEFLEDYTTADIEDLFTKEDYLKIYNLGFPEKQIKIKDLDTKIKPIIIQINKFLKIDRFNHYMPANKLAAKGVDTSFFSETTLDNFEKVFKQVNKLF